LSTNRNNASESCEKKIIKKSENEREMNGQNLIIQCAQNAKRNLGKKISQLFG